MKKSELIHWQLQAMLREHSFSKDDLAYLGVREDSIGIPQHCTVSVVMKYQWMR